MKTKGISVANFSSVPKIMPNVQEAMKFFGQALNTCVLLGQYEGCGNFSAPIIISVYNNMSKVSAFLEKIDQCFEFSQSALDFCAKLQPSISHNIMSRILYNLGSICLRFYKYELGLTFLDRAISITKVNCINVNEIKPGPMKSLFFMKGSIYLKLGKRTEALGMYQLGLSCNSLYAKHYNYNKYDE